ncbi:Wiskott-Aldrich syndrome protein family member 3 [Labeo rohita]|uniref:Wiskott-Aldrich syndrome protein family member n=1 Tax=Labeo rohita TaxID=84645 RepID=A0ABQ8LK59_LABRO|nr:Wiskott-Aldrich syndrome protein family member 3 [Labeo rohita]
MPLVKRTIEPKHLCRGALPDGVTNELECVTNSTLAAIIKQLGGLSRHAEDIFGELFNEANSFYMRMNSLQERVDLLAVKVTQLDSTVEEGHQHAESIQELHYSGPAGGVQKLHPEPGHGDVPPLDDKKDGLKFYTDPSYFFNLWKEKMLQATENKRKEKRRQKQEQKHIEDPTREVKKVRKARNRRQEWNMMAYDKEFRPDTRLTPSGMSDEHSYPASPSHPQEAGGGGADGKDAGPTQTQSLDRAYRPPASSTAAAARQHSLGRVQAHHGPPPPDSGHQILEHFVPPAPPPPPPLIPSSQTAFDSTSGPQSLAPGTVVSLSRPYSPSPPPAPASAYTASPAHAVMGGPPVAPPPPPPGPPTHAPSPSRVTHPSGESTLPRKGQVPVIPMSDARSDLLAAIRRGIQLRKVQEQREQEAKKEPVGNDVATILSRRIAVEYSESDEDSEPEENECQTDLGRGYRGDHDRRRRKETEFVQCKVKGHRAGAEIDR